MLEGEDPADVRDQQRAAITLGQLCDVYLEVAEAGLVHGRKGVPKKASTVLSDRSRINAHVRPLLGQHKAAAITRADVETFKRDVVLGKTAKDEVLGFRKRSIVEHNPVRGMKRFADKQALLTVDQYRWLDGALTALDARRDRNGQRMHSAVGLAAIRCIALTGARRGEIQHLRWEEVDANGTFLALGETKTGASLRPVGRTAFELINAQPAISDYVFPTGPDASGYGGLSGLWKTVQRTARMLADQDALAGGRNVTTEAPLDAITIHSLRHRFAGTAESLGATVPTIAALLGHRLGGVTGGYILKRVDVLLIDAASRVADHIAKLMRGEVPAATVVQFVPRGRPVHRRPIQLSA